MSSAPSAAAWHKGTECIATISPAPPDTRRPPGTKVDPRPPGQKVDGSSTTVTTDEFSHTDTYTMALSQHTRKRGFWDMCRENPISERGKRLQLMKMLFLTLIPIVGLAATCIIDMKGETLRNQQATRVNNILIVGTQVGSLVHYLQRERDMTAMYVQFQQQDGSESRILLTLAYPLTNKALADINEWPWGVDAAERDQNKVEFTENLVSHRAHLEPGSTSAIQYYTTIIKLFLTWFEQAITVERVGNKWKALIAYKWLIECKEDYGKERTMGGVFFNEGSFSDDINHLLYLQTFYVAQNFMKEAIVFQPWVETMMKTELARDNFRAKSTSKLGEMRKSIREYHTPLVPSHKMSTWWFDNMTVQIDVLFIVQQELTDSIMSWISRDMTANTRQIYISVALLCAVSILSPVIVTVVKRMISDIQEFARILSSQAQDLINEKRRTNSLLYQMLPPTIASQLKNVGHAEAENFDDVTIYFSDIKNFTDISAASSAFQIVQILDALYTCFDAIIDKYDVYKIEAIADAYMIASGVPKRNGRRHASQICKLALDLLHNMRHVTAPNLSGFTLQLRAGVHSGPVVAGVVGSKMPRYCLFGDTVNTASRMETNGAVDRVHISHQTKLRLDTIGGFKCEYRGAIAVKGKGTMMTYWLNSAAGLLESLPCMPGCSTLGRPTGHHLSPTYHSGDDGISVSYSN